MADTIIDGTTFNSENIRFTQPKANSSGGKSINLLNKATNTGLRLSTPLMLTWGASDFKDAQSGIGNGKFELSLQFPSDEYKTEETTLFLKNMQKLEHKIKTTAFANSKDWFGKVHKSQEVVDELFTPMLKYTKDKTTGEHDLTKSPTLRIKIPIWENIWKVEIYDEDEQRLFPNATNPSITPLDLITKGTNVAIIMQCGGIWFANGKFSITWKLVQAVVQKPKTNLTGKCFLKLKASDKDKLKNAQAPQEEEDDDGPVASTTFVEDDEPEQEETTPVQVVVPVVVPVKAPVVEAVAVSEEEPKKKKMVIKKKAVA